MDIKTLRLYKIIFGYDIFISYSRKDSLDYAYTIAQHFLKKGFDCYIDQLSSITPGGELPSNIKDAVKRSTAFVLIGSEGSQTSEAIEQEIQLFLDNNKNKPLIPITINGAISCKARWYGKIAGLALIDDTLDNLKQGVPAQDVLDRIENALKFTKKSKRLRNISLTVLLGIFAISGLATYYTTRALQDAKAALIQKEIADSLKIVAINEKKEAVKQWQEANKLKHKAEGAVKMLTLKSDSLNKQIIQKNKKIAETTERYTRQYKSAQEMYNEFDRAIDAVPQIKNYCFSLGELNVKKGQAVVFFKLDRSSIGPGGVHMLDEFIKDWKNSVNKPTIIVEGHYQAYRIDEESLDVIKLNDGGTDKYNMAASTRIAKSVISYLINNGIPGNKISGKSYGESEPISKKGILFNNRAEIYTAD